MAQVVSNLPIGAKIKFGKYSVDGETAEPIIWLVVAKNHSSTPAYPTNSITLLTEKIIDLRCIDAVEPNNSDPNIANLGNSRYSLSNIDQWLNKDSAKGAWYVAQHSVDQSPTRDMVSDNGTMYVSRPGFLNAFTSEEKNAIKSTTIRVALSTRDGGGYEDISRKVFLASTTEVGLTIDGVSEQGSTWGYFSGNSRITQLTTQAFNNTDSSTKPSKVFTAWPWWLRTPKTTTYQTYVVTAEGVAAYEYAYEGEHGIRPALNLSSSVAVTDSTDSDGCYTISPNAPPVAPSLVSAPATVYGGKSNSISWTASSDPNGDTVTYHLECSIDNGTYATIYSGTATTYAHLVPFGATFVVYRVKATDPSGESSAYTVSATKTVVNNNAPVISGTDSNLGVKSAGFTGSYTITDADSNTVTVTEAIDGVQIRALVATLNTAIPYSISGNTWLTLPNGSHTFTITATDGTDTTVRTYVFTKMVERFTIRNSIPWVASTRPSRIMVLVTRNIPSGARFKVEVCNNGLQGSPTWEDCTAAVESGLVHVFSNQSNSAASWGVLVRVTVERNGAAGACYVSTIGGNFE